MDSNFNMYSYDKMGTFKEFLAPEVHTAFQNAPSKYPRYQVIPSVWSRCNDQIQLQQTFRKRESIVASMIYTT